MGVNVCKHNLNALMWHQKKKRNGGHFTPHALSCTWVIKDQNEVILVRDMFVCLRTKTSAYSNIWDKPKLLGWGGGGNRVREKCSYPLVLRTSTILYFWCPKPKSSCPKSFPVFFPIKNVLVRWTSHVKGLHVRTKFLPVSDNRT